MKTALVVVEEFMGYVKGQIIDDYKEVEKILKSEWERHVVKIAQADTKDK